MCSIVPCEESVSIVPSGYSNSWKDYQTCTMETYSFSTAAWRFNNVVPEIIHLILSYLCYFNTFHIDSGALFPFSSYIVNVRLVCRHWNEALLLDYSGQLKLYYQENRKIYLSYYITPFLHFRNSKLKRIFRNYPLYKIPESTQLHSGEQIMKTLSLISHNVQHIKQVYRQRRETQRVKQNMKKILYETRHHSWKVFSLVVYILLVCCVLLLFFRQVLSLFASPVGIEPLLRYFYNIIFAPLHLIIVTTILQFS